MADKQYGVSPEFKALFLRKQKQRMEFREYFLKHSTNPFRHGMGDGGYVFDPAVHRLHAMAEYANEYFKPNARNTRWLMGVVVLPIFFTWRWLRWYKERENEEIRTGRVAYKDRQWKTKV